MLLKLPPRIKVLEALGSIADGRIKKIKSFKNENIHIYEVHSSRKDKKYTVILDLNKKEVYSNDNGTLLKRYIGYPIIAALFLEGLLDFDEKFANNLKNIKWKDLNEKYRRYYKVEFIIKKMLEKRGIHPKEIDKYIEKIMNKLKQMNLTLNAKLFENYFKS